MLAVFVAVTVGGPCMCENALDMLRERDTCADIHNGALGCDAADDGCANGSGCTQPATGCVCDHCHLCSVGKALAQEQVMMLPTIVCGYAADVDRADVTAAPDDIFIPPRTA